MPIPTPLRVGGLNRPGAQLPKRFRRKPTDAIMGITKPAIRRLARRGGVKRIQSDIYDTIREALKAKLASILQRIVFQLQASASDKALERDDKARKTVTTRDVVYALYRMGSPLYGFDNTYSNDADPVL